MDCLDIYLALPAELQWMIYQMLPCKVQQVMELGHELNGRRLHWPDPKCLQGAAAMGHVKCIQYEFERNPPRLVFIAICDLGILHRAIEQLQADAVEFLLEVYDHIEATHPEWSCQSETWAGYWKYRKYMGYRSWWAAAVLNRQMDCERKQKILKLLNQRNMLRYLNKEPGLSFGPNTLGQT